MVHLNERAVVKLSRVIMKSCRAGRKLANRHQCYEAPVAKQREPCRSLQLVRVADTTVGGCRVGQR